MGAAHPRARHPTRALRRAGRHEGARAATRPRKLAKLRRQYDAVTHLYAEGEIDRAEYERRITSCRAALSRLESVGATAQQHEARLVSAVNVLEEAEKSVAAPDARRAAEHRRADSSSHVDCPFGYWPRKDTAISGRSREDLPPSCELGAIILKARLPRGDGDGDAPRRDGLTIRYTQISQQKILVTCFALVRYRIRW